MSVTGKYSGRNFASIAHYALIGSGSRSVRNVAKNLNMKENTLYTKLSGRARFDVEEARNLLALVPDPDLANYVLELSGYFAAEKINPERERDEALRWQASRAVWEAADILKTVEQAISDGRLDHREKMEIRRQVEEAERALASLKRVTESL